MIADLWLRSGIGEVFQLANSGKSGIHKNCDLPNHAQSSYTSFWE
jgi:hypothetical protein